MIGHRGVEQHGPADWLPAGIDPQPDEALRSARIQDGERLRISGSDERVPGFDRVPELVAPGAELADRAGRRSTGRDPAKPELRGGRTGPGDARERRNVE